MVIPLLKKSNLDPMFKNLRPVSNLAYISKLTERAVFNQTYDNLVRSGLYSLLQSACRQYHSTETALVKVANDVLLNMNSQRVTLLVLLDLSTAFDTVNHEILLRRLTIRASVYVEKLWSGFHRTCQGTTNTFCSMGFHQTILICASVFRRGDA